MDVPLPGESLILTLITLKSTEIKRNLQIPLFIQKVSKNNMETPVIEISANIKSPLGIVWNCWTTPEDIIQWNHASDDWHSPRAENDLRVGGKFNIRMEARDGSTGFDFEGTYLSVILHKQITYSIGDGRLVKVDFSSIAGVTTVTETFEAESVHSLEQQRAGWQSILDNFKKYAEEYLKK
jgi:uncharacterized protein YndB with AHSA1/START domain